VASAKVSEQIAVVKLFKIHVTTLLPQMMASAVVARGGLVFDVHNSRAANAMKTHKHSAHIKMHTTTQMRTAVARSMKSVWVDGRTANFAALSRSFLQGAVVLVAQELHLNLQWSQA
jgi:hypothetical protein